MLYIRALSAGVLFALMTVVVWITLRLVVGTLYWRRVVLPSLPASATATNGSFSVLLTTWELVLVTAVGLMIGIGAAMWVSRRRDERRHQR
jgi:ABC-type phosphate transport system permease subunit